MTKQTLDSMAEMPESAAGSSRRNRRGSASGASNVTAGRGNGDPSEQRMLEEVVERQNMRAAYQQVKRNAGAPGIDGMSVEELGPHLREEWQRIKEALLAERFEPQPVKRVEIPKPGGGVRQLGIPTVVDRLIQQALHQVMSRVFEPGFSESECPREKAPQGGPLSPLLSNILLDDVGQGAGEARSRVLSVRRRR